jgi:hypothetical protein
VFNTVKTAFALVILILLCTYATWQRMEMLAIASMVALLAIIYRTQTRRALHLLFTLIGGTKQAKLGALEVNVDPLFQTYDSLIAELPPWMQIMLKNITPDEIGILLSIYRVDRYSPSPALMHYMRHLRDRHLIAHDGPTLSASKQVWVTDVGHQIAEALLLAAQPSVQLEVDK